MSYKEYLETGITVIPKVFSADECEKIKQHAYTVSDDDIKGAGYPHQPSEQAYNKKSLIFFPALANDYINKIRIDFRMQEIVKEYIGNNVRQINNQIYFREAGDKDQFAWHRDTIFREQHIFSSNVETDYLQTIIAVDNIREDNGAVEFIEGSHRWEKFSRPRNLREFERSGMKGTKYIANKGDVLVWSVMIVHGSESNFSNSDRMTYMNGFCKTRSTNSYPDYMVDGKIIERIDPTKIP